MTDEELDDIKLINFWFGPVSSEAQPIPPEFDMRKESVCLIQRFGQNPPARSAIPPLPDLVRLFKRFPADQFNEWFSESFEWFTAVLLGEMVEELQMRKSLAKLEMMSDLDSRDLDEER